MSRLITARAAPLAILGGLLTASAGLSVFDILPEEKHLPVNLIIGAAMLLFILGAASLQRGWKTPGWLRAIMDRIELSGIQFTALVLAVLCAFLASAASGETYGMVSRFWIMIGAWAAAIGLVIFGGWKLGEQPTLPDRKALLMAVTLFIGSLLLRGIGLESAPPVLNGDEASAGLTAVRFINGETNNPFGVGWFSFPTLFSAIQALPIKLLGQTTFALRLPSVLIGSLTVPALYLVWRKVLSPHAALFAAISLLGAHFHIHFSRIGLNNIWDAFWYVIGLGFLVYGWQNSRRAAFLAAGLSIGLAQYFYVSSRFLLLLVPVWLVVAFVIDRKKIKGIWMNLLLMLLTILVAVLPLAWFYLQDTGHSHFLAPFNRVDILGDWLQNESQILDKPGWQIIGEQIWNSARTFVSLDAQMWYPAGVPILRPAAAVLFLAGLLLLIFRLRRSETWMLLAWVGLFVVSGGFSVPVSAAQRYVAAVPICALLIGLAVEEIRKMVSSVWPAIRPYALAASLIILGYLGFNDVDFYFNDYTPRSYMGGANTLLAQRLADHLKGKEDLQVAFFGGERMGYYSINSTAYLAPDVQGLDFREPWGSADNPDITADHVLFVFLPETFDAYYSEVKHDFPDGKLGVEFDVTEEPLYWSYQADNPHHP